MTTSDVSQQYDCYLVLTRPSITHQLWGRFVVTDDPLIGHALILRDDLVVAHLDERAVVIRARDQHPVYLPPDGDLTWLRRHPDWPKGITIRRHPAVARDLIA